MAELDVGFTGRGAVAERLEEWWENGERPFVVVGEPGADKSAIAVRTASPKPTMGGGPWPSFGNG